MKEYLAGILAISLVLLVFGISSIFGLIPPDLPEPWLSLFNVIKWADSFPTIVGLLMAVVSLASLFMLERWE
ncbi:MAG: hypothetical protein HYU29_07470 [Chloroflexi bacterium]|nr:hypothetical protein [Chloroflexota bacterium]